MKVYMTVNILLYGGITIIIIGLILYFVADYMVKYYDKQIKKHTFEIVQPKIKRKKWIHLKKYLALNIRGFVAVKVANS